MAVITLIIYSLSLLQFADSLFKEGDYFNAITEYKRAVYLKESPRYALWKIGLSYERRGKPGFAAKYFGELAFMDDLLPVTHHLAYNLIEIKRYREAILVLESKRDTVSLIMHAAALGLSGDFKQADSVLISLNIKLPSLPNDNVLRYPSYIVPGFGLFLLGDYKRGLLSCLLTTGTGYLTYYLVKHKRYPEAIVTFNTLFLRFYSGNIQNAIKLKKKKQKRFYMGLIERYVNGSHCFPGE